MVNYNFIRSPNPKLNARQMRIIDKHCMSCGTNLSILSRARLCEECRAAKEKLRADERKLKAEQV